MEDAAASTGDWSHTTVASLQSVWSRFINFLPQVLAAALVLLIGWVVARLVSTLIRKVVHRLNLDRVVDRTGVPERIRQGGVRFTMSGFIAGLAYWIIMLVTFTVMADTLHWVMLGNFLRSIVAFIPNVLVAMAILVVGVIASRLIHDLVEGSVRASGLSDAASETIASVARISVIVFSVMAALTQLNVAEDLVKILFAGVVAAAAIGVGLAFGLGGRDRAEQLIQRMSDTFTPRSGGSIGARARAGRHR